MCLNGLRCSQNAGKLHSESTKFQISNFNRAGLQPQTAVSLFLELISTAQQDGENAVKIPVHSVKSPKRGRTPTKSRHHVSWKGRESKCRVDVSQSQRQDGQNQPYKETWTKPCYKEQHIGSIKKTYGPKTYIQQNNISKGPQTKMLHVYVGSSKPDLISQRNTKKYQYFFG